MQIPLFQEYGFPLQNDDRKTVLSLYLGSYAGKMTHRTSSKDSPSNNDIVVIQDIFMHDTLQIMWSVHVVYIETSKKSKYGLKFRRFLSS